MITRKDLAPLDGTSLELWRKELKHRKANINYIDHIAVFRLKGVDI